jgi:1,4-dihydroxy-2-naphthoyl-CoA hydrolase
MKYEGVIEFSVVEQTAERVVSEMPIRAGVKNPFGVVHAGATLWFADVTATLLVMGPGNPAGSGDPADNRDPGDPDRPAERMKRFPLAINLNANFVGNQTDGSFRAVSAFVKRGRTVSIVRTLVYGAGDKLIADVTTNHVLSK